MKKFSKLRRSVASLAATVVVFTFAIPLALAAPSSIDTPTASPNPFHAQVPGHEAASKVIFSYTYNSGGNMTADLNEYIKNANGDVVYFYGTNIGADTYNDPSPGNFHGMLHEWDGKANTGSSSGQFVPNGAYTFVAESHTTTPPDATAQVTFDLEKAVAPSVALQSVPSAIYYTPSGNYTVNYSLDMGSAAAMTVVRLTIHGPLNNNPQDVVIAEPKNADGNYAISWDGEINNAPAPAGSYTYSLQADGSIDGFSVLSNNLTGNITVSNDPVPSPTFSNLTVGPNPYEADDGDITFGYNLNGSAGNTTVSAAVYASSDMNTGLKSWTFNNQSTGSNSIVWDGKVSGNTVANGAYVFKVWGNDGSFNLVPMQVSFTVVPMNDPSTEECAGYSDVDGNDSDCAAIEYMKSTGAMTGNPDGTFAPDELLQRDQIAKIVLETFNEYNSNTNYCNNVNPFPDVTSSAWAFQYICRGVDLGMITGYLSGADAGYYRPSRSVNRAEFLALVLRNLSDSMPSNSSSSYSDVETGQWFSGYAKYSKDHQLFTGSNLHPTNFTARREVADVIYKLHQDGKI